MPSPRPSDTFKLAQRHVPQLIAVRPERGDTESEEEKVTIQLTTTFQNVQGVAATGVEKLDHRNRIGNVFLRVERWQGRFDFLRDELHF